MADHTLGTTVGVYLDMGGYAAFVWPAYGIAAAALVSLVVWSVVRTRKLERKAAELRRAVPADEDFP
jgi:heme exporter protein D